MKTTNVNGQMVGGGAKITWHVSANPKQPGSAAGNRCERYLGAATVQEYHDRGGTSGDLQHDHKHRFISIEGVAAAYP